MSGRYKVGMLARGTAGARGNNRCQAPIAVPGTFCRNSHMRAVSADNDWTGWLVFFLQAVKYQADYNLDAMNRIGQLYESMKGVFSEITGSKHAISLLDAIFTMPVFRNQQICKRSGIPPATVNRFTKALLADGRNLLKTSRPASGRRAAVYSFEPLLELIRS